MHRSTYGSYSSRKSKKSHRFELVFALVVLAFSAFFIALFLRSSGTEAPVSEPAKQISFDDSFSNAEKQSVLKSVKDRNIPVDTDITAHINTTQTPINIGLVQEVLVPVTSVYSGQQQVIKTKITNFNISVWHELDTTVSQALAGYFGIGAESLGVLESLDSLKDGDVAFVPVNLLSSHVKLLSLDDSYYLDSYNSGAVFREVVFTGKNLNSLNAIKLNNLPTKATVFKVNQTGVTALTRGMMLKLNTLNDPLYFSQKIAPFLKDADITHVSNEVSFKDGCAYSTSAFCSDPRFIETLKDSGVNLVELAGNHNNDTGRQNNKDTIDLYHSLGWQTIGGGLNTEEAAKYYVADIKQSKVAFLSYNFADSPNGVAIATKDSPGANSFDFSRIETDIANAKKEADFVIVDVQYWECYSYPDGFVEFPICDKPIGAQEENFKKLVDLGADMVVGAQAHQPQTYEIYKGKPIYYGLGNLYFDQIQWPGTERGIILSHYFNAGKLLQTRLSPTVFGKELQTHLMANDDAENLLSRLQLAR